MGRKIERKSAFSGEQKKSPDVNLTEKEGNYVVGTLKKKIPSALYKGKFSYLIAAEDTNARTTIWDKEKKAAVEVDINEGDTVFLKDSTILHDLMEQVEVGERIKVEFTGLGEKKPGQKAPFFFDVEVL